MSESEKMGLLGMTGFFLGLLGSAVSESRSGSDGATWFRFGMEPLPQLRDSAKKFLKAYNAEHGTKFAVSFAPYRMVLREGRRSPKKSARRSARGQGTPRDS